MEAHAAGADGTRVSLSKADEPHRRAGVRASPGCGGSRRGGSGWIGGRKGSEIDKLKGEVQKRTKREVHIDIQEVHRPELDATLVAESIALQLEKRVAFRRAMRKAVDSALRFGCKGIKVRVAGRLN